MKNPFDDFAEVRCPKCNKLLFKIKGVALVEIICPRCPNSRKVLYPDFDRASLVPVIRTTIAIQAPTGG